ncbi:MAG: PIN domain-containing protein [Verrucomicrobiia bacterium]
MKAHYLVDSNILLCFLSGQPPAQAEATKKLFAEAAAGDALLDVCPVVVAEVIYTLVSFYRVDRKEAAEKLSRLLQARGVKVRDKEQVLDALERLATTNVGFADAFLAAGSAVETISVASFDRDLDKFKDVRRFEPQL